MPALDTSTAAGARKFSNRLGCLTDAQFQAALDRFSLGKFVKAEPICCGLFGQNVYVTSSKGEFVLRGCPHFDWQFPKERYMARFVAERTGVPAPWPYLLETSKEIFGWGFVLMPRMPGTVPVDDWYEKLSDEDKYGISLAMGETLARLHAAGGPCIGDYDLTRDEVVPITEPFAEWITKDLRNSLRDAKKLGSLTTDEDIAWLDGVLDRAMPALGAPCPPSFVMHDFKRGNLTVSRAENGWAVTGLFDFMEPFFADSEIDLWRHLAEASESELRGFLKGYLRHRTFRPGYDERMQVYMLMDRMAIWGYGVRPDVNWFKNTTFRAWIEKYLKRVEFTLEVIGEIR